MEERATGIILRTRPLTDTSLIVNWLTPDFGRISTVAKGARRPTSPFLGKIDLFYEADFSFVRSRKSELHTLKEIVLTNGNSALRQDVAALTLVSYFAVLTELVTETETPLPEVFELWRETMEQLASNTASPRLLFGFEVQLLIQSGFEPLSRKSALSPEAKEILKQLAQRAADDFPKKLPRTLLNELNLYLSTAIGRAWERIPNQRITVTRLFGLSG